MAGLANRREKSVLGRVLKRGSWTKLSAIILGAMMLLVCLSRPALAQKAQDFAGTWQGTLQTSDARRVVLKISKGNDGGVLYDVNWGDASTIPLIVLQGATLKFTIPALDASYLAKLGTDGTSMAGMWTQGSATHALNLVRATEDTAWAIAEPPNTMPADTDPTYDTVTVKPSDPNDGNEGYQIRGRHILVANETVSNLISFAYGIHGNQIAGGSAWLPMDKYYIDGVLDVSGAPNLVQFRSAIRKLLADRFQLKFHTEKRELPVYALTIAKGGPKLTKSLGNPNGPPNDNFSTSAYMKETNTTMNEYAKALFYVLDKPVVDQTGLEGRWDFLLKWTPDSSQFGGQIPAPTDDPNAPPGLFTAIQEQLGLKLAPVKVPVDVIVIDHIERPSAN